MERRAITNMTITTMTISSDGSRLISHGSWLASLIIVLNRVIRIGFPILFDNWAHIVQEEVDVGHLVLNDILSSSFPSLLVSSSIYWARRVRGQAAAAQIQFKLLNLILGKITDIIGILPAAGVKRCYRTSAIGPKKITKGIPRNSPMFRIILPKSLLLGSNRVHSLVLLEARLYLEYISGFNTPI